MLPNSIIIYIADNELWWEARECPHIMSEKNSTNLRTESKCICPWICPAAGVKHGKNPEVRG